MATKKKSKKSPIRRRRRSVGAVNKDLLTQAAGALGGYVLATMAMAKIAPTLDSKIKGAVVAALGVFGVPMVLKNSIGRGLAIGFSTAGGIKLLQGFNVISGVGLRQDYLPMPQSRLNGAGINAQVNGTGQGVNAMVNGSGINSMVNGRNRVMNPMNTALKYG